MTKQATENKIRIYVADLAASNSGFLHGVWIDATQEIDDIQAQINTLLDASPIAGAEEYAIHDYEGFEGCQIYEHEGIQSAHDKALFIQEHGEVGARLLAHTADDIEEATTMMIDRYIGVYESVAEYAQERTEDAGGIPQHLKGYIDYERMARDIEINELYVIKAAHDALHLFRNQ